MSTPVSTTSRIPVLHQRAHLGHHRADRHRAVGPAAKRDDAERAAVVAALLHLDEGARPAGELGHQMRRGLARGHDVADQPEPGVVASSSPAWQFFGVAQHAVDVGQRGPRGGVDLGRAAGDDDPGVRPLARQPADRLARLALGLGGHRAGVDDHGIGRRPSQRRRWASPRITSLS